ncbi:MAG: hypothetical protein LBS11_06655 [Oscillospiraceae bacterium]|jgi:muramoyltetrapeptide carboxypeptidase LdcA involved in peptidoglycan recycling|nr:hypothetical protein [Oscillospiraceae bacterium]
MEASMIKPRALRPHSHIGIVGPSSPVDPVDLYAAKSALEALGYRVTLGEGRVKAYGYLAAVDEARRRPEPHVQRRWHRRRHALNSGR